MKFCHENIGATIYIGRATTTHNPCFNVYTTVKYLNRNDSIVQMLQHISNSIKAGFHMIADRRSQ